MCFKGIWDLLPFLFFPLWKMPLGKSFSGISTTFNAEYRNKEIPVNVFCLMRLVLDFNVDVFA